MPFYEAKALSTSAFAFLEATSSATALETQVLFTGLKNVPNDLANTKAIGMPIIVINNPAI